MGRWGPSSVNAASSPQPPAPLGPPPRLLPGAPAPHSGAEPTSRTPRPGGGRFRRAPRGGGRPTPFRPRCARRPARSPRPPPRALGSPLRRLGRLVPRWASRESCPPGSGAGASARGSSEVWSPPEVLDWPAAGFGTVGPGGPHHQILLHFCSAF